MPRQWSATSRGAMAESSDGRRRLSAPRLLSLAMGLREGSTVAGGGRRRRPPGRRGGGEQGRCPSLRRIQREGRRRQPVGVPAAVAPSPPLDPAGGEPAAARRTCDGGTLPFDLAVWEFLDKICVYMLQFFLSLILFV
uniref:Uncharacterized protein n=1 Tax=Oryza glaberrima TaxID=4538 RepID=I1QHF5_ORYGL